MDAVLLIVTAIVTGLSTGFNEAVASAVKDTYYTLKTHLEKKIGNNQSAKEALAKVENEPTSKERQEVLKEELVKLDIQKDTELVKLAQTLLKLCDENGTQAGKYNVSVQDTQGVVIGDYSKVTQNFGKK